VYRFALEKETRVEISVFDTEGRKQARLSRKTLGPGNHAVSWNGKDARGKTLAPGLYLIVLKRDRDLSTR
jgi:hypothetical protein